jgi:hypothetical protein
MKFNWLALIELILGEAANVVPIFVHNPKSQQVEAVIVTTLEDTIATLAAPTPAAPTPIAASVLAPLKATP